MLPVMMTRIAVRVCAIAVMACLPLAAAAQRLFGNGTAINNAAYDGRYIFARIRYGGWSSAWNHDYPRADRHLQHILDDLTLINDNLDACNVLDLRHPIFHSFFELKRLDFPHPMFASLIGRYYALFENNDPAQRMLALANHDNDLAELWEWSDTGLFPVGDTNEAYKLGVNYVIYAMTH